MIDLDVFTASANGDYVGVTPQDDDIVTSPLDLVIHTGRRRSPTLAEDCVSPLSTSPDSSPAGASDTGIETGSDVSSSCGDVAAFPPPFNVVSAAATTAAAVCRLRYDCLEPGDHAEVKPEPESACRSPACEQDRATSMAAVTPTQSFQPSAAVIRSSFQRGITVGYTYEAFIATDGRSRRRKTAVAPPPQSDLRHQTAGFGDDSTATATVARRAAGRYSCSECGRHYATSSNLSRHKQTHRSLDSRYARACPHCHKPYVSMPALAMHVLTHNLKSVASPASWSSIVVVVVVILDSFLSRSFRCQIKIKN